MKYNKHFRAALAPLCAALALAALGGIVVAGCGGGGGGTRSGSSATSAAATRAAGQLTLTVKWPARSKSRLIPLASNSIHAVLTRGGLVVGDRLLTRPDGESPLPTSVTFTNVPAGAVVLTATAFPVVDGTGVAQAAGAAPTTVVANQTANVTVTMASTIDHLAISPANPSIVVGASLGLTMTAFDAAGNVVLVTPSLVSWQSSDPRSVASVDPTGIAVTTTGVDGGTATITVKEAESGKTTQTNVTVTLGNPDACVPGPVTGNNGLLNSPWPRLFHDNQNTNRGGAGGATGVLKWIAGVGSRSMLIGSDNNLTAGKNVLSPADGSTLRALPSQVVIYGANGFAYGIDDIGAYAFDVASGVEKWRVSLQALFLSIGGDGTVYIGCYLPDANNVIRHTILAVNGTTGARKWTALGGGAFGISPLDGTIYAINLDTDGSVVALEPSCGTTKWTFKPNADFNAISGTTIALDGTIYVLSTNAASAVSLTSLDPSGHARWTVPTIRAVAVPSLGADGTIYVTESGEPLKVTAYDSAAGAQKWQFVSPNAAESTQSGVAIAGDNTLYVVGRRVGGPDPFNPSVFSALYALDGATGAVKWTFAVPGPFSSPQFQTPTIGPDGTVYLYDDDNGGRTIAVK